MATHGYGIVKTKTTLAVQYMRILYYLVVRGLLRNFDGFFKSAFELCAAPPRFKGDYVESVNFTVYQSPSRSRPVKCCFQYFDGFLWFASVTREGTICGRIGRLYGKLSHVNLFAPRTGAQYHSTTFEGTIETCVVLGSRFHYGKYPQKKKLVVTKNIDNSRSMIFVDI